MDSPSNVKAGLRKSVFSAIKGSDRFLRPNNNANVQQKQPQGMNNNGTAESATTEESQPQTAQDKPKLVVRDEKIAEDNGIGLATETTDTEEVLLGGADNAKRRDCETVAGKRLRKRRSVSCEPTANNATKITHHKAVEEESGGDGGCLQRAQSFAVVGGGGAVSARQLATVGVPPIASSSRISSRIPSSVSICSFANSEVSARKRSPSGDGSLCSKEERSLSSNAPKIKLSICAKALYACANGHLDELTALVEENPELINYQYPYCYRYSCLHIAAKAGDFDTVRFLVKRGAKLNAKDCWSTPLHLAAQAGHLEMTKLLREMGANASALDAYGKRHCDYLPADKNKGLYPSKKTDSKKPKASQNSKHTNRGKAEADSISTSSGSNHSQISQTLHYHLGTFRKPIERAMDLLHRK